MSNEQRVMSYQSDSIRTYTYLYEHYHFSINDAKQITRVAQMTINYAEGTLRP